MAQTVNPPQKVSEDRPSDAPVASETILELLNDEYARSILDALDASDKSARELATTCDVSLPTVYRRLDRLECAALVKGVPVIHPEGHHRKQFTTQFERIDLVLEDGTLSAQIISPTDEQR